MIFRVLCICAALLYTSTAQVELTGLSFGCGNVSLSCSSELMLVVERVSYVHGTHCQQQHQQQQLQQLQQLQEHDNLQQDELTRQADKLTQYKQYYRRRSANIPPIPPALLQSTAGGRINNDFYVGQLASRSSIREDSDENMEIWDAMVTACAGYKRQNCRFHVKSQLPHLRWEGRLEVQYTCAKNIYSYCGGQVKAESSGYVSSPGYPKYYLGKACVWNITAGIGQKLHLTLLDTALRTEDCLEIQDGDRIRERECGKLVEIKQIVSSSNTIIVRTVNVESNQQLQSRRGVLLRYKTIGCAVPPPIADGRLVFSNESYAEFACNEGHVFKSSLTSFKSTYCRGNLWEDKLEHCVSIDFLLQYGGEDVKQALVFSHSQLVQSNQSSDDELKLEVVALVLVGVLLLVSLSIPLVLYLKYKETGSYLIQDDQISMKDVFEDGKSDHVERY